MKGFFNPFLFSDGFIFLSGSWSLAIAGTWNLAEQGHRFYGVDQVLNIDHVRVPRRMGKGWKFVQADQNISSSSTYHFHPFSISGNTTLGFQWLSFFSLKCHLHVFTCFAHQRLWPSGVPNWICIPLGKRWFPRSPICLLCSTWNNLLNERGIRQLSFELVDGWTILNRCQ